MKKIFLLVILITAVSFIQGQEELHIHHINVENGDATIIGIYDLYANEYTSKVIIDGGQANSEKYLLPYIRSVFKNDDKPTHFQYAILTHYHNDHYNGLLALKNGTMTADSIIDPGGYTVSNYFLHSASRTRKPESLKIALPWLRAISAAAKATPSPFVKGRSKILLHFGAGQTTNLGNYINLGTVGGQEARLVCIAGWGNSLSEAGRIEKNPRPEETNGNNFSLAFLLICGEFRYFIGGDMGGVNTGHYINQETLVANYLRDHFPNSVSFSDERVVAGHLCGFKANHHGSQNSNISPFLSLLKPAIFVTSAGNNKNWHLPHPDYIKRIANTPPLTQSTPLSDSVFPRGIYFTNLYNFPGFASKTIATNLFSNRDSISFDFGNNVEGLKGSYLVKVTKASLIERKSAFEVGRIDISTNAKYTRLAYFLCHEN